MKKTKLVLIIAGALCIAGILIAGISFTALGWDVTRLDTSPELEQKLYTVSAAEVTDITVDTDNFAVEVVSSANQDINLVYYMNETKQCDISNNDGKLKMVYQSHSSLKQIFQMFKGFKDLNNVITVQVPVGYTGDLFMKSANAHISVEETRITGNLTLQSQNSSIQLDEVVCASVAAVNSNGSIRAENMQSDVVRMETQNASITLESVIGRQFHLSNENGKIKAEESTATESATMKTSNGSVKLDRMASANFDLSADNGSVSGTIKGKKSDYQISSATQNGSSNLENRLDASAPNILQVKTSNGSVRLTFDEN